MSNGTQCHIVLPEPLAKRVDKFAKVSGMSRTSVIKMALTELLTPRGF